MSRGRQSWLDWPIARLTAHAEANREDIEVLNAILTESQTRGTPQAEELATRVQGMLGALGIVDELEAEAAPASPETMALRVQDLQDRLAVAERKLREAETRAAAAERRAQAARVEAEAVRHPSLSIHERVHLSPSAPGWLVEAAQRAFRQRFHPDRYPDPTTKSKAEAVFKEAETVFSQLRRVQEEAAEG